MVVRQKRLKAFVNNEFEQINKLYSEFKNKYITSLVRILSGRVTAIFSAIVNCNLTVPQFFHLIQYHYQ